MQGTLPDLTKLVPALQAGASAAAARIADAVRPHAPVGHSPERQGGQLRDSLVGESEATGNGVRLRVTSDVPQARYVIEGTSAHAIRPLRAGSLRFWVEGGSVVFAKSVQHPGTAPNPFADAARDEIEALVRELVEQAVQEALR